MLQEVCPVTASCMSASSLEQVAAFLLQTDKRNPQGSMMMTRKDDVVKALEIWSDCFDRLAVDFQLEAGAEHCASPGVVSISTYITVICELPRLMPCPKKTSSRAVVARFSNAITSGVTTCIKLVKESQSLKGSKLQYISEVAEVTRTFAEDFCDIWKAELGETLIPRLLDMTSQLSPAAGLSHDVAAAMHRIGVLSFCSGLLCHLVTRCPANQQLVQKNDSFNDLMREVLPAIPALDVQLEMLEVLFRVYRNSRSMPASQFDRTGLSSVKEKLDRLVAAKGQKLNLTKRLVDIAVSYNADPAHTQSVRTECLMGPITVLPITKAQLKSKDSVTAISKDFDSIALSRSCISLMMKYALDDGAQDDWLVIPTSTLTDSSITAITGSKVNLSATIPRAFHRNTATEEVLGEMKTDCFDIVVCLDMMPPTACKLRGIIQPLLDTHNDAKQQDRPQMHTSIAPVPHRPSAAAACVASHRRLSITTMPVFQPLTFQSLPKTRQTEEPVGPQYTIRRSVQAKAAVDPAQSVTPSTGVATDDHKNTERFRHEATNKTEAFTACHIDSAAAAQDGEEGVARQLSAPTHHYLERVTARSVRCPKEHGSPGLQHQPSKCVQEPVFVRRRRHQQADKMVAGLSNDPHRTGNDIEMTEAGKVSAVRLPSKNQQIMTKGHSHVHRHQNPSPFGRKVVSKQVNMPLFESKEFIPASDHQHAEHSYDQVNNMRKGRPKRRAALRKVDYREGMDDGSADEVSDPISETTLPIPHAQASKKKIPGSFQARTAEGKNYVKRRKGDRSLEQIQDVVTLPDRKQMENSGRNSSIEKVISETQSDVLDPSKTRPSCVGKKASQEKVDGPELDHAGLNASGDKEGPMWAPTSSQQARSDTVIHMRVSNVFPTCDGLPPVHGHAVVPSPLTHKPLQPGRKPHMVPSIQSFQFDRQEQLRIPELAGSMCPAESFAPTFLQDLTKVQMKFPSMIESCIQRNTHQLPAHTYLAAHDGARPRSKTEHAYQCSTMLPRDQTATKVAQDLTTVPAAVATKKTVAPAKRRRNAIESHTDDASQQAQEQQVMVMRMMNAMMQNEDDDDDQNMLQLQAAMSKLMKTKEQRKKQQNNKAIHSSKQRLDDMLNNAVEQYTQEEAQLEQDIASKLVDSTQRMSDLWNVMRDMHSQHLASLANKWQEYQMLGNKLNEDHQQSLQKTAEMKARWSGTLTTLTQEAEAEMQQLEGDLCRAKKRSRRRDPASMQKLLSALMQ